MSDCYLERFQNARETTEGGASESVMEEAESARGRGLARLNKGRRGIQSDRLVRAA